MGDVSSNAVTLDPHALGAILAQAQSGRATPRGVRWWRLALVVVALTQLVAALWGSLDAGEQVADHVVHELASWDVGLAAGLLLLAWQPSRAWGALPLLAALVVGLVGASALDVVHGNALIGREVLHALALSGLACVWALALRVPRSSIIFRVG